MRIQASPKATDVPVSYLPGRVQPPAVDGPVGKSARVVPIGACLFDIGKTAVILVQFIYSDRRILILLTIAIP
jgi:hypothetical protein